MEDSNRLGIAQRLRQRIQHSRYLGVFSVVAVLLALNVGLLLAQTGYTKNTPVTVLDCHYNGNGAHTHNADCYDASGTLVCPLEVRELHTHTEDCYEEERTLVCGLEESDEHTHTDDCYEITRTLICGKEEVTEEHVHSAACFITVNSGGEEDVVEGELMDADTGAATSAMPAQRFAKQLTEVDEDGNERVVLTVVVESPEGALPVGTYLQVKPVDDETVDDKVSDAVKRLHGDDVRVKRVTAVDITFFDAEGNELEPAQPVEVDIISDAVRDSSDPMLVHVDEKNNDTQIVDSARRVKDDEAGDGEDRSDTLRFTADRFSPYVIIEVEKADDQEANADDSADQPENDTSQPEDSADQPEDGSEHHLITTDQDDDGGESSPYSEAQIFTGGANGVNVVAKAPEGAFFEGTQMQVNPVDVQELEQVVGQTVDGTVEQVAAVDIVFYDEGGNVVTPMLPVKVTMTNENAPDGGDSVVVHVDDAGEASVVDQTMITSAVDKVYFNVEDSAIYAMVVTTLQETLTASDGNTYQITVDFTSDANIPADADLQVSEITADSDAYETYRAQTAEAMGDATGEQAPEFARFFDITIVDGAGQSVQPAAPVDVRIELADAPEGSDLSVVHFSEDDTPELLEATTDGTTVSFATTGFSVYAIVDAPAPIHVEVETVATLDELGSNTQSAFRLSVTRTNKPEYFTNVVSGSNCFSLTTESSAADDWFFEPVAGGAANNYRMYTYVDGAKKYVKNTSGNLVGLVDSNGTVFELSEAASGTFYIKIKGASKWLQYSKSGGGIRFWTDKDNTANSQITLSYSSSYSVPDDPYELDGVSFGVAYHNDSVTAAALMAEGKTVSNVQHLVAEDMLVRPDVLNNEGVLLVAENSDITEWTFRCVSGDTYYLTTTVDGATKYLTINGRDVTLEDAPTAQSVITVTPGTEEYSGKYTFGVGSYSLACDASGSNTSRGFWGTNASNATKWLSLVKKSSMNDDDFNLYTARKVSVSDTTNVHDGQQVVIYTRVWNDATKRYEFYAVDHDGSLVRCYDVGDAVEWIGSRVNTALWNFTEYTNSDGTPNYYYDLQNVQYGGYLAPQIGNESVLSDGTVGVNLNGRRNGENYTTIVTWDTENYSYAGLKAENGRVVPCPLSEADDFYFALVNPQETQDELTKVDTIDSDQYGITMKMINFNNSTTDPKAKGRDAVQTPFFGKFDNNQPGLLSTNLDEESGYPMTTSLTGHEVPLSDLYNQMTPVNHLFIESIYNESGYFEYDSTSNFAHLNEDGTFTVYDQLAAIGTSTKETRTHGQFMPYNEIVEGQYAQVTNRTDVLAQELPDTDPRKGEKLYLIPEKEADYFFGMEMEASFTQPSNGLDAWGHDIIFEFSGDDDFWFYVDGELVLDLGGVHSAMTGSINFRTGEIESSRGNSTLYQVFKQNYQARGMSTSEINRKLDEIFKQNSAGQYVFKDYTNHDMKMFYMERGAGASNLHMRFNLAAVRPGTFVLSKKLSGTDNAQNKLIEFPYQVYYYTKKDHETEPHLLGANEGETDLVTYVGSSAKVKHAEQFTPAGGTQAYDHVFFLKPGQSAEVALPEGATKYYVVECGVNPSVYDHVSANGVELRGTQSPNAGRSDFATDTDTLKNRRSVEYDNHVSDGAMRTLELTKVLYDSDGETQLHYPEDKTAFDFRLYLGDENADSAKLPLADMYSYHVKDSQGRYCVWNVETQSFDPLAKTDYASLTAEELKAATFTTSMNGAISMIPADHTVEVRDLIVGTQFKVEERSEEIPKGYTLRLSDGYTRVDGGHEQTQATPISGTVGVDETPQLEVRNQKGWGLTVDKVWTDADFMDEHDPIYFAVYVKRDEDGMTSYTLLDGSVRQLPTTEDSLYYFFGNLKSGTPFENYIVFEVNLTVPEGGELIVDDQGVVSGYDSVTPISDGGRLVIGGKPVGGEYSADAYTYHVAYEQGEQSDRNENVRVDTVTNSRPGIALYKTDWGDTALAGAKFTLKDAEGKNVAAPSYTSTDNGLITIAYLSAGTYTLEETASPKGYVVMDAPMTITVAEDGVVTVDGIDESYYTVSTDDEEMAAVITVKNRPSALQLKKVDISSGAPLRGVHFALYRQVTDIEGHKQKDYQPMAGYADLATDQNGILPKITMDLPAGTYYLEETRALKGYELMSEDLCFTIGPDGTVSIDTEAYAGWLTTDEVDGNVSYTITVPNGKLKRVQIRKICVGSDTVLEGAGFALYQAADYDDEHARVIDGAQALKEGTTDEDGLLLLGDLASGEYRLVETEAPDGYLELDGAVKVFVFDDHVEAKQGNNASLVEELEDGTWQITVWNNPGVLLPASGGFGTTMLYLLGCVLLVMGAAGAARSLGRIRPGGIGR